MRTALSRIIDPAPTHQGDDDKMLFLIHEGLELLAAYRSIADRDVRLALKHLVAQVARSKGLAPPSLS